MCIVCGGSICYGTGLCQQAVSQPIVYTTYNHIYPFLILAFSTITGFFVKFKQSIKQKISHKFKKGLTGKLPQILILFIGILIIVTLFYISMSPKGANTLDEIQIIQESPYKPNIIIILSDALRADHLGIYGYPYNTSPNIDNFAKDATLFKNAYSQAPWTVNSVATLFSSLYPTTHLVSVAGGLNNRTNTFLILGNLESKDVKIMPEVLKSNGYFTIGIMGNPWLFEELFNTGFSVYKKTDSFEINSSTITKESIFALENHKDKRPLFLYVHYMDPHAPYVPSEEFDIFNHTQYTDKYIEEDFNINKYDGEILETDAAIQELLEYLKENNLYDNSLILFIADHGEQFGEYGKYEHGNTVREVETHVPFILKLPKNSKYKLNKIEEKPVGLIDIYPTILDLLEIK
ncbi:MAG: sulfatase, partial [Nanoarchaeota archaeon]